ncbi:MAG TPA: DUF1998 domain-containing protein, partial [Planctomycetaceae bacterium]|nr:DUF1998 domain-containing protein [Planctomycetaceae bacterium]
LLDQMLQRWNEIIRATKELLHECPQNCESACYSCLLSFRNQFNHGQLNRHKALELIVQLQHTPNIYRTIAELDEETSGSAGDGSGGTNTPEARLVRLLRDHHFPDGACRVDIKTSVGMNTRPDWLHETTKVAVYLDGMSRNLHGDEKTAQRDQLIRQMLELDGYRVIVVQSKDLNDPQASRLHLRNIANAISRVDLAEMIDEATMTLTASFEPEEQEIAVVAADAGDSDDEILEFVDGRCRDFIRDWLSSGHPEPIVGYALANGEGILVAESELAWPTAKVAAIFTDTEAKEAFDAAGWKVYDAESLAQYKQDIASQVGDVQ